MGVRLPRTNDGTVLDRRKPDDGAGELQRQAAIRIVFRRRVPAEDDADWHVSAQSMGLADMHGNVWEWTSDWYGPYAESAAANIDPHGLAFGDKRVIRGGSWFFDANSARCGLRHTHAPQDKGFSLGFRVAADRSR